MSKKCVQGSVAWPHSSLAFNFKMYFVCREIPVSDGERDQLKLYKQL